MIYVSIFVFSYFGSTMIAFVCWYAWIYCYDCICAGRGWDDIELMVQNVPLVFCGSRWIVLHWYFEYRIYLLRLYVAMLGFTVMIAFALGEAGMI